MRPAATIGEQVLVIAKGDLYWVNFGSVGSSAPAKRRPAVVVQSDHFNRSRLSTVIVAAISSNTALADHPGNVFLPAAITGLRRDSVINVTALATIDRKVLSERIGILPGHLSTALTLGLRVVLDL
jgi:mRNA interferase MazF